LPGFLQHRLLISEFKGLKFLIIISFQLCEIDFFSSAILEIDNSHSLAGNIVVHFFLPEVREVYELEKLWTLGPKYDDQTKAMLEEDKLRQAAELGIKLDKPVPELDENLDDLDIDPLGLDDPRRY